MVKDKVEKINYLKEVSKILKEEFVGLDLIIDQIISSLTPWYVTPEIIERPVILSLWGMTGTGKSSIVRRLTELLDLKDKSLFIDCGEITGDGGYFRLSDKLNDFMFGDMEESNTERRDNRYVFIFDEFQYARTLDAQKNEIEKAAIRPVWSLIDSGKLDFIDYQYGLVFFKQLLSDLGDFCSRHPNVPISGCVLSDPEALVDYINELGYFFYDRNPLDLGVKNKSEFPYLKSPAEEEEKEEKNDPYAPLNVLDIKNGNPIGLIYRGMNRKGLGEGKKVLESLQEAKTLTELYEILLNASRTMAAPKIIDCSRSLIFVIGNLDEAFRVEEEMSPDMSADIFNDITSKVTINDIKTALTDRFRAEQVARLGNNLIKYPTLREKDFREIIRREVNKIFRKFKEETDIEIKYEEDVISLVYSEGVFPTQGVRPVFTTIVTFLTPILSEVVLWAEESGEKIAFLKTHSDYSPELGFRVPKISLLINNGKDEGRKMELNLQLGALRYPGSRKRRFSTSVHEIGHAIVSSWCTGNVPVNIVSVATDDGGFCDTYDEEHHREIESMEEVKNDIMISMAGYLAESIIFEDEDKILTGSSNDLSRAWNLLIQAAYEWGMFGFYKYTNDKCQQPNPPGLPAGDINITKINSRIENLWSQLINECSTILRKERNLLKKSALILSEVGSIDQEKFTELIKRYGSELTLEHMEKKKNSDDWYKETLENF